MYRYGRILCIIALLIFSAIQMQCSNGNANNKKPEKSDAATADSSSQKDSTATAKKDDVELIPVETMVVDEGTISSFLLQSSNLETEEMADVYARIQGLVDDIKCEEGEHVQKGQVLLTLEAEEYELAEEKAQVNYQQKQNAFERVKAMYDKNLLSQEEYEQAKFAADAARIERDEAKLNLGYTKIKSPISGYVTERLCRPGDRIQPSDKLFTVINTDEMIAVIYVPEREIGTIEKNQSAYIMSSSLNSQRFPGRIKRVSPAVDPQSGTFKVTVGVENVGNKLKSGMFVNVHVITNTHENAVLIPKTAIVYENERMNVFVVRDSIAHKISLNVGFQDHEKVESLDDIAAGEQVIVVGQSGLKDRTKVKVVHQREQS
ncbi:efflux RND transporter periplasmic adaptor subunit [candidate division KSB1 bacterium]|nr:efflux RND transporter periplasmic adaptor subunit [candidate division KSB1 bacterium]